MAEQRKKFRLGDLLVQQGLISTDQLAIALAEQRNNNIPIGRLLVRLGFVTETAIRDIMSRTIGQESIDLTQVVADSEALKMVPQEFARRNRLLPIAYDPMEQVLTIATAEIFNVVAMDQLRAMLGGQIEVKPQFASEDQLETFIDQFYGFELSVDGILHEIETGEIDYESVQAGGDEYTQPMVRLVNALLVDAVKRGASDIHFEPEYAFLRIRFRIDGVLETVRSLHKTYMPGITVRLKVVSDMNIAETRAPQDGRLSLTLSGRQIDFRVSTQPTIYGENIVLRILDREKSIISLDRMNLAAETLAKLNLMLARPEGILIVTGPTGSGKTTTLYSLLAQVNDETVNIMTLEDPVEYPLTLMRQTSVNEVARMDFANGIRSIMRQDPDIILVGEVRDKETAEMAFRAAMTGHQVFTTLHTNSALGAFPRLLDIGIQPDIMAGNIIGVIAQRLVRVLCPHCKEAYAPSAEERLLLGRAAESVSYLYRPVGCKQCENKGYRGRAAIMELLVMDSDLDELVARRATVKDLRAAAMARNFRPLANEGLQRVVDGTTSLAEVSRAVDLTGRYG
ncbi:MAG: secretion system protein E [Betaproteobacteria bacterium RIFCSPLOWO2_12_FULL_62_58]|nr:MAG: secretion system protein E [Betaproteobacteria bacterium RIFCSPLOWO2_02_FULL_62_79]OGA52126.1 MAG: secretion system protein E [Betaproteobacteria bacterium RIFCSPLOWO2_12_FULL_62_58]